LIDVRKGGDLFSLDMYYGSAAGLYPRTAGVNDLGNPVRDAVERWSYIARRYSRW
jgi:hypothetical protein